MPAQHWYIITVVSVLSILIIFFCIINASRTSKVNNASNLTPSKSSKSKSKGTNNRNRSNSNSKSRKAKPKSKHKRSNSARKKHNNHNNNQSKKNSKKSKRSRANTSSKLPSIQTSESFSVSSGSSSSTVDTNTISNSNTPSNISALPIAHSFPVNSHSSSNHSNGDPYGHAKPPGLPISHSLTINPQSRSNDTSGQPLPDKPPKPPPFPISHSFSVNVNAINLPISNPLHPPLLSRSISDYGPASPIQELPRAPTPSFENIDHGIQCNGESINECDAIQRIIVTLKYYESLDIIKNNDSHNISKLIKFINDNYKAHKLLDDFIHINTIHNNKLEEVQKFIVYKLETKLCDINHCIALARHNRDRNLDRDHEEEKGINEDEQWIFIRDTFDNIHSYLFHTFDMGLKIKVDEMQKIKDRLNKTIIEDEKKYEECTDGLLKNVTNILRKNNKKLKSFGRFKGKKYHIDAENLNRISTEAERGLTWSDAMFEYLQENGIPYKEIERVADYAHDEDFDTDSLMEDVIDFIDEKYRTPTSNFLPVLNSDRTKLKWMCAFANDSTLYEGAFSTGFLFFYWPYYRNKIRIRHKYDNIHQTPKKLYIRQKYESLEEEILNNKIYRLKHFQFTDCTKKADHYINTDKVKSISSAVDCLHYGLRTSSPFTKEHLLSLILYCDWSDLCTAFSATFRRQRAFEPITAIKSRNREFWWLSKLLRETVELYGDHKGYYERTTKKWSGVKGPFFCGMSFVATIPSFNISLYGPTSTSPNIEVATRFGGDKGIIIELNNNGDSNGVYLRCFNCAWVSNFNGEEERLFFGGRYRIKIEGVRLIETRQNYSVFFNAMFYFDCMVNGSDMSMDVKAQVPKSKLLWQIMERLIMHKLKWQKNTFPDYVNQTFEVFCVSKREITLNLHVLYTYFFELKDLILEWNSNMFKNLLFKLFKNLRSITILSTNLRPYLSYAFRLSYLCEKLDIGKMYCGENLSIIVMAERCSIYLHDDDECNWSWLYTEYWYRLQIDGRRYRTEMKLQHIVGKFPRDKMIIYRV